MAIALIVAAFGLCACGSSGPRPFRGSAVDKANEVIRRATLFGMEHDDVSNLVAEFGTNGGYVCDFTDKRASDKQRFHARALGVDTLDHPFNEIVRDVYCPRLR